jgi:hypothetical protein
LAVNNRVVATANGVTAIVDTGGSLHDPLDPLDRILISPFFHPTGTTLLIGDDQGVAILYSAIPGSKDASAVIGPGFFTVPCNRIPTVGIELGGALFNVAPAIFNLGVLQGNDCVGGVVSSDGIRTFSFLFLISFFCL